MTFENQSQMVECIVKALPYPQHIKDWDLSKPDKVYFTWLGNRFKVYGGMVSEIQDIMEIGSDISILVQRLIEIVQLQKAMEEKP